MNARWSFAQGGKSLGRPHHVVMVILAPGPTAGLRRRNRGPATGPFIPARLADAGRSGGKPACAAVRQIAGQAVEHLVAVLPHATLVRRGPYRGCGTGNYVAVVAEGFALPLVHTAWLIALGFHPGQ